MPLNFKEDSSFFDLMEKISESEGIIKFLANLPFDLSQSINKIPLSVCHHFNLNFRTMWDKKTGTPRDVLFDAVLE